MKEKPWYYVEAKKATKIQIDIHECYGEEQEIYVGIWNNGKTLHINCSAKTEVSIRNQP